MRALSLLLAALVFGSAADADAQRRRPARRRASPPPMKTVAVEAKCPEVLGVGAATGARFCFVLAGRDPAEGIVIALPRRTGAATLRFDLHNRHTYSEEDIRLGRGYASYQAVIGVLAMNGDLISRAAVQSEFRTAADLYDRIRGGAGPSGLKAVAPIGREQIAVTVPVGVDAVSLLGETLDASTAAGRETANPGRPVALVSNVRLEYRPR